MKRVINKVLIVFAAVLWAMSIFYLHFLFGILQAIAHAFVKARESFYEVKEEESYE